MDLKAIKTIVITSIFILIMACNIPGQEFFFMAPTVTPDLRMTELFAQPINISTATLSPAQIASQIPLPTKTPTQSPSPSPTASPTSTFTPTLSPTAAWSACYRTGERFDAVYFTPSIDGVWDEWGSTQYPASYVIYGSENWVNSDDLGASFRVSWDKTNLYIAAKVGDDRYVQNAAGQDMYKGDSLEILLDANLCGDYYNNVLSNDDFQLGISPGRYEINSSKEAFMWFPHGSGGSRSSVAISSVTHSGGYRVEASIPWSIFGVSPWSGLTFGFAFSVSDNDNSSTDVQESMVSSVANRHLTRPETWGTLVLR